MEKRFRPLSYKQPTVPMDTSSIYGTDFTPREGMSRTLPAKPKDIFTPALHGVHNTSTNYKDEFRCWDYIKSSRNRPYLNSTSDLLSAGRSNEFDHLTSETKAAFTDMNSKHGTARAVQNRMSRSTNFLYSQPTKEDLGTEYRGQFTEKESSRSRCPADSMANYTFEREVMS
ncbi:hypothetical protein Ciccas_003863 [Cichlidogyrus casuarinus]|uniref:Uncharacterized protein n=1 Tax=Cichlidogyrus casuarinus TaxID=1844966 RepID=A0ABD2QD63_9PLAT